MKNKYVYLVGLGAMLLVAGAIVGATAFLGGEPKKPLPTPPVQAMKFKWYDVEIDGLSCQVGIPSKDEPFPIIEGYFDLTTPAATLRTIRSVSHFMRTRENFDQLWSAHDDPIAAREWFCEQFLKKQHPTWEEIKGYYDMFRAKYTTVEDCLLGVFRVELPNNDVICRVLMLNTYRYKGKDYPSVSYITVVKRGTQWLYQSKQSDDSPQWKPYDRAFMMIGSGGRVIMECRKRAGVKSYEDVLKPKTLGGASK